LLIEDKFLININIKLSITIHFDLYRNVIKHIYDDFLSFLNFSWGSKIISKEAIMVTGLLINQLDFVVGHYKFSMLGPY
jgi:hypothetical protein